MNIFKPVAKLSAVICCAALLAPLSAFAAPHKVCHYTYHDHHRVRVCHLVH